MEESNSDKETFYSADSLENITKESKLKHKKLTHKKDCKKDVVSVPFYEGDIPIPLSCVNNIVKNMIKKKIIQNKTASSNVSRYDTNFLRLNLSSVIAPTETTVGIPLNHRPSINYPGPLSSASSCKTTDPKTNVTRTRNRSVSYLEQYKKRSNSTSNKNHLHGSATTINKSTQNITSLQDDFFSSTNSLTSSQNDSLNTSNLSEKKTEIPVHNITQSTVLKNRISSSVKKHQSRQMSRTRTVINNDLLMKPDVHEHPINDKLASLKKRKDYGETVKKKNQEELSVQKVLSKNKVRGRSTEKTTLNYDFYNHKIEQSSPPDLALLEKRKEFSEKVKHKNRVEFMSQKIQQKAVSKRKSKENIVASEDCFTKKIGTSSYLDKPLVKPKLLLITKSKETNEKRKMKNYEENIDLEALQRRHEQDKIKAKAILNKLLKT